MFLMQMARRRTYKRTLKSTETPSMQLGIIMLTCSFLWVSCGGIELPIIFTCSRICLSTNRDTLLLLWRLIQICNFPPPVHILRVDTVRQFLKLPDHTFSWRLVEPPGSSQMELTLLEVSARALSLSQTYNHTRTHACMHAHRNYF